MKIAKLDLEDATRREQFEKVIEEFDEVKEAFNEKMEEELVEELWDLIQSCLGLLFLILPSFLKFKSSYIKHLLKMRRRASKSVRRISIVEWIKL